ncbi:MAG: TMEM165/GDT1 family protein [Halobacteria archaeon]|nr:TMEM165/GDT1 family protein [Halobacteria archaeon]
MIDWITLLVIAFTTQLAVLPGEKVQLIIAGLSTRYNPVVVVSAAGTAFAGWTALEILLGNALKGALPEVYLDVFSASLFVVFAVLLYRSAPGSGTPEESEKVYDDVDVSVLGWDVPDYLGGFLPIFAMMAAGEFGDKTQVVTIGLAAQYGAHPAIWAGEMLAIIPVSIANAFFFHRFSHRFDVRKAHYAGAVLFVFFAGDTVLNVVAGFSVWERSVSSVAHILSSFV